MTNYTLNLPDADRNIPFYKLKLPPRHVMNSRFSYIDAPFPSPMHEEVYLTAKRSLAEKQVTMKTEIRKYVTADLTPELMQMAERQGGNFTDMEPRCGKHDAVVRYIGFMDGASDQRVHDIGYYYQSVSYILLSFERRYLCFTVQTQNPEDYRQENQCSEV